MRSVPLLLLLAGCSCPKPLCAQWLVITVRSQTWTAGTYTVDVVAGDTEVHCTIVAVEPGRVPDFDDVSCNAGVAHDELVLDTAELVSPQAVELRVVTGSGADVPASAVVRAALSSSGATATYVDEVRVLAWNEHLPPFGTCARGCYDALVALDLP